jgi:peptide/nickel transport system ATP-binding protein
MGLLVARGVGVTTTVEGCRTEVLRDIGFAIEPGRVLGLVGESGAGKSMIGRLVGGQLPPGFAAHGSLEFRGRDLLRASQDARRALLGRDIAFIPQQPMTSLNPVRTVGALFDEHWRRLGVAGAEERRRGSLAALADVRLPEPNAVLAKYAHQLSGGMCQRVLIAMAFASRPALLVADEPTTALDVITQARIVRLLADLRAQHGTAVIFITHDLRLAAQVCDEIVVLYAGEAVERAPARALLASPLHPYTRALLRCNPGLTGPRRRLVALPEHMPGLTALAGLAGCRFAPRCPIADPACRDATPALAEAAPQRWLRAAGRCRDASRLGAGDEGVLPAASAARHAAAPVLRVAELGKTFVARHPLFWWRIHRVEAATDVSFELAPGEFVGIVGQSGSGKSTIARLLLGLEAPSRGRIELDGRDVTGPFGAQAAFRAQRIQMIFQDPQSALNPRRRVGALVTQPMEADGAARPWSARLARARELLGATGMPPEAAARYPAQLSGGQRQRVNIARALCNTPLVLVADEIISGLDVSIQAQILNLLLELRARGGFSLLLISHDLSVVRHLCDRVLVMYRGAVVEAGAVGDIFAAPRHWYTKALLAAVPPDDPRAIWRPEAAEAAGDDAPLNSG